jgi:hypothetical protein
MNHEAQELHGERSAASSSVSSVSSVVTFFYFSRFPTTLQSMFFMKASV